MISTSLKMERCPVHLRPGSGGLRLPTAKFSEPTPGVQAEANHAQAALLLPARGREGRLRAPLGGWPGQRRDRPEPHTEGGLASAVGGSRQRQPRRVRPLASRPPRPGSRARIGPTLCPGFPGSEERKTGVSRGAAGRSLPLHHSRFDLDLPHSRIGHGPQGAAGRRGGTARRAGAEGALEWAWC